MDELLEKRKKEVFDNSVKELPQALLEAGVLGPAEKWPSSLEREAYCGHGFICLQSEGKAWGKLWDSEPPGGLC